MPVISFGSMANDYFVPSGSTLPEPGETIVSTERVVLTPGGGKGMNQSIAAARAGSPTFMAGALGADIYGEAVLRTLKQDNVDTSLIHTDDAYGTGLAFIFVDKQGENCIICASGANQAARQGQIPDALLNDGTVLMMQMEVRPEENWALIDRASRLGARTILNFAPATTLTPDQHDRLAEALSQLDYLIVNEKEAEKIADILHLGSAGGHEQIARAITGKYPRLSCTVTLGGAGSVTVAGGETYAMPAYGPVTVVDTTGAGDAFCGGFAAALEQGFPLREALMRASITGALACTALGCQEALPHKGRIDAAMSSFDGARASVRGG